MLDLSISTIAERPELAERLRELPDPWPGFLNKDKAANAFFEQIAIMFPNYCIVATSSDGSLIARGTSIPFAADGPNRDLYPDGGWESVMIWGFTDQLQGLTPTAASALEIVVDPAHIGEGVSHAMLTAMRDAVREQGHQTLVAPVRPTEKDREPHVSCVEYMARTREDGLPEDPWLRVHVRAGGTIVKVAPASTASAGSLTQWRAWTGLPFDHDGDVEVPGALVPVQCNLAHDYAAYVEPNVWVHHDLSSDS